MACPHTSTHVPLSKMVTFWTLYEIWVSSLNMSWRLALAFLVESRWCVLPCLDIFQLIRLQLWAEGLAKSSSWTGVEIIPICSSWNKRILLKRCIGPKTPSLTIGRFVVNGLSEKVPVAQFETPWMSTPFQKFFAQPFTCDLQICRWSFWKGSGGPFWSAIPHNYPQINPMSCWKTTLPAQQISTTYSSFSKVDFPTPSPCFLNAWICFLTRNQITTIFSKRIFSGKQNPSTEPTRRCDDVGGW